MSHLAHLTGHAREQVKETKKQKQNDLPTFTVQEALQIVFLELWTKFQSLSEEEKAELELELRFGMIVSDLYRWKSQISDDMVILLQEQNRIGLNFRAGVDETFVNELHSFVFHPSKFTIEEQPVQRIKLDKDKNRYEIAANNSILSNEKKVKLTDFDLSLLGRNYDLRVAVSREQQSKIAPADLSSASIRDIQFQCERLKRRTSYRYKNDKDLSRWRLDLTEVTSRDLDPTGQYISTRADAVSSQLKEIELEIELTEESKCSFFSIKNPSDARVESDILAASLSKLLNLLIPATDEDSALSKSKGICLIPSSSPEWKEMLGEIHKLNTRLSPDTSAQVQFLGSKPLNMNRRGLYRVRSHLDSYFMTEKSDGVRNILYVVDLKARGPTAVLMNRVKAINIYSVPFGDIIGQALRVGTVLDGELVFNLSLHRSVFLVFDVIANEGVNVSQFLFERRLAILNNEVMKKCALIGSMFKTSMSKSNHSGIPLEICRKQYYGQLVAIGTSPHTSIHDLFSKISLIGRNPVYRDSDRRHHKIDGVIFQPNRPYLFGTADPFLLKWKYEFLRSVDLQASPSPTTCPQLRGLNPPEIRIPLLCGGPDGVYLDITRRGNEDFTMFGRFDQYRLLADMNDGALASKSRIVEVCFDESCGLWKYLKLRVDKDEPNFIDTVIGVLTEQGENISIEELELALLPGASNRGNASLLIRTAVSASKQLLLEQERKKSNSNN